MRKPAPQFNCQKGATVSRKTSTALAPLHQLRICHAQAARQPGLTRHGAERQFDIRQLRSWPCHWLGFRVRRPLNQPLPSVAGSIYLLAPLKLGSALEPRPDCVVNEHQAVAGGERPAMGEIPAQEVCFRPFYDHRCLGN